MAKNSKKIKVKNNTANKKARAKFFASITPETPQRVVAVEKTPLPSTFEGVNEAYQAAVNSGDTIGEMFSTCPVCNDDKVQKARATEASRKAEMILVIRDIVSRFRTATNAKFTTLSADIQDQLRPIVEASNKIAITRSELQEDLSNLEEDLKSGFGITDEIDPTIMGDAMFVETYDGDPLNLTEAPTPGTDPAFDRITDSVDTVLLGEEDSTDVESIFTPSPEAPLGAVRPVSKGDDRTKWN